MLSVLLLAAVAATAPPDEDSRRLAALGVRLAEREARLKGRVATVYRLSRGGLPRAVLAAGDRDLARVRLAMLAEVVRRDVREIRELALERDALGRRVEHARVHVRPPPDPSASALDPLRGRLPPPVGGTTPVPALGGLGFRAHGVLEVRAVAPGRVVFAAPFEGFEQLVMVDHGGGDTSLYARLGDLAVSEGDAIRAGQTLGHLPPGGVLYFEIRRGADLLPAARWLRGTDR
jgi:peptidase M23-like protein